MVPKDPLQVTAGEDRHQAAAPPRAWSCPSSSPSPGSEEGWGEASAASSCPQVWKLSRGFLQARGAGTGLAQSSHRAAPGLLQLGLNIG